MQKWQLIIFLRNTDIIISINGQEKTEIFIQRITAKGLKFGENEFDCIMFML